MLFRIICNFHVSSTSSTRIEFLFTNAYTKPVICYLSLGRKEGSKERGACSILMIPTRLQSISYSSSFILHKQRLIPPQEPVRARPPFIFLKTI